MKIIHHQNSTLPALGFGTFRMQGEECYNATRAALDIGYRHLDTAQAYENEEEVGRALDDSGVAREEVFLTTKCHKDKLTAQQVKSELDDSLSRLRTDAVDLLLIHWPSAEVPLRETLDALQEAQATGKTRHIGVSNFTVRLLKEATETHGAVLFTNQIEYHPLLRQPAVNACTFDHGMLLTGHSPIATGRIIDNSVLQEIGTQYGKTASQVAIRWQLEQDMVMVLPKSRRPEIIRENFEVFDFSLSEDDMKRVETLPDNERGVAPPWSPDWDAE